MTAWAKGSTRKWRKTRLHVLNRDRWICHLCGHRISRRLRRPHPKSASVHHLVGKAYGDDPSQLVAAHLDCNLEAGNPMRHDPQPRPGTSW